MYCVVLSTYGEKAKVMKDTAMDHVNIEKYVDRIFNRVLIVR